GESSSRRGRGRLWLPRRPSVPDCVRRIQLSTSRASCPMPLLYHTNPGCQGIRVVHFANGGRAEAPGSPGDHRYHEEAGRPRRRRLGRSGRASQGSRRDDASGAGASTQELRASLPRPPNGRVRSSRPAATLGAMTPQPGWNPGRAAGNTVIVVVTLVGLLCVLPVVVFCLLPGLFGAIFNP